MDDAIAGSERRGWPDDLETLKARLADIGLPADTVSALAEHSRPALMLATTSSHEDAIPIGATKIGGRPDLPPDMEWPTRPPYPNAEEAARQVLEIAASFMASASIAPPWLTTQEAERLIEQQRVLREETEAFLRKLDQEAGKEWETFDADDNYSPEEKQDFRERYDDADAPGFLPAPTAEDAEQAGREAMAKAEALTGAFPLAFIAQLDLTSLSAEPGFDPALPSDGRLYLFYDLFALPGSFDPGSRIGFRVLYDNSSAEDLARIAAPAPLAAMDDASGATLTPARVTTRCVVTTPSMESLNSKGLQLCGRRRESYDEWLMDDVGWPGEPARGGHQLGGWARSIPQSMQGMAQLAANGIDAGTADAWKGRTATSVLADAGAWRLLFQLGANEEIGNRLPGGLNFLLRTEDLAERRFENAWVVYEQS